MLPGTRSPFSDSWNRNAVISWFSPWSLIFVVANGTADDPGFFLRLAITVTGIGLVPDTLR